MCFLYVCVCLFVYCCWFFFVDFFVVGGCLGFFLEVFCVVFVFVFRHLYIYAMR